MKLLPTLAGLMATANASLDMTNLNMPNDDGKCIEKHRFERFFEKTHI